MSKAVIIYGPPGSGKGTQADLLARKFNFIHLDTGRYLESLFRSPKAKTDPILKREKANFDSGILCSPEWVLKITREESERIAKAGYNLVFSGSPRTMFEAFGGGKTKGLTESLIKSFGKENISVVLLNVEDSTSIKRNSHRVVCSQCGLPKLESAKLPHCALCAGTMRTRSLDNPEVIKVRLKEYRERTYPIVSEMKKKGFTIKKLDGESLPYKVSEKIIKALKLG
ncbi:MAG: nucleoside monophosphate kinase [Candidatus Jorgensenbacteria bacterium]|nr:nucleoside monophosphate kinase [Candidatus Jorgensenbacteria bacterium]